MLKLMGYMYLVVSTLKKNCVTDRKKVLKWRQSQITGTKESLEMQGVSDHSDHTTWYCAA